MQATVRWFMHHVIILNSQLYNLSLVFLAHVFSLDSAFIETQFVNVGLSVYNETAL
jgi:hypothetical protein